MRRLLNVKVIACFFAAILTVHVLATYYYWYWLIWWLDIPMHLAGGFLIAMLVLWYLEQNKKELLASFSFFNKFFFVLGAAALVGIFWEFYEFFYDVFFKSQLGFYAAQLGAIDTVKDLANDLMGAAVAFLIFKVTDKTSD
ncbi:MAG: hypothetical protein Q8P97_02310 [bacterium]|nr:hypothetical protein [bacterium]